jgi:hypothetical protein
MTHGETPRSQNLHACILRLGASIKYAKYRGKIDAN